MAAVNFVMICSIQITAGDLTKPAKLSFPSILVAAFIAELVAHGVNAIASHSIEHLHAFQYPFALRHAIGIACTLIIQSEIGAQGSFCSMQQVRATDAGNGSPKI